MEGAKSEWLIYRALYLEMWRGGGAPGNEMHKEEVSEEARSLLRDVGWLHSLCALEKWPHYSLT